MGYKQMSFKSTLVCQHKLSPYLFIVVIDWVIRNAKIDDLGFTKHKHQFTRIPEKKVIDLEYADDIGLL